MKPVLLKRGMYSTINEWLSCAEYIMTKEIRRWSCVTRYPFVRDLYAEYARLSAVPSVKEPAICRDRRPAHGTGRVVD